MVSESDTSLKAMQSTASWISYKMSFQCVENLVFYLEDALTVKRIHLGLSMHIIILLEFQIPKFEILIQK
jgi:hypothetical protein